MSCELLDHALRVVTSEAVARRPVLLVRPVLGVDHAPTQGVDGEGDGSVHVVGDNLVLVHPHGLLEGLVLGEQEVVGLREAVQLLLELCHSTSQLCLGFL